VYAPGENARLSRLVWVDRDTRRVDTLPFPSAEYGPFSLAPDGDRVIARIVPPSGPAELWVLNGARGEQARIPVQGIAAWGQWWPDGASVLFSEYTPSGSTLGTATIRQQLTGAPRRDTLIVGMLHVDISRDGSRLAVSAYPLPGLTVVPLDDSTDSLHIPTGPAAFPMFSPDGRAITYTDWAPEKAEVKLVRIDAPDIQHTVSIDGGEEGIWTPDGKSLVYRQGWQWLQADVDTTGGIRIGVPRVLFEGRYQQVPGLSHDLSPDGRRHLVLLGPTEQTTHRLVVVTNWFEELAGAERR
jgi:Tol biopolymer transport system component